MSMPITHDRGLGSAYERYHFYQLVARWAESFGIKSLLEGPRDGMAGVPGVHGVGVARQGIPVLSVVRSREQAEVTRAVYERTGATTFEVRTLEGPLDTDDFAPVRALPPHDMVIAYHALETRDWRPYLRALGRLARKILVVTTCNPHNWGVTIVRSVATLRGVRGLAAPDAWRTEILAPELWEIGRVKSHVYFDAPWWPDLQVSPGQSLLDRAKRLWTTRAREMEFTASGRDSVLAQRFVYGAERWPYFGGEGWLDELQPALERHPAFEGRKGRLGRLAAHLHAFVVDTSPRTPQARRRLEQVPTGGREPR
jgi:hypothetical protein